MTTELIDRLREKVDGLALNERAIKTLSKVKNVSTNDDLYPVFLKGVSIKEIIFKPTQQIIELYNESGFDPTIVTIIGIYIEDDQKQWTDNLRLIGYFEYQTDIDGEYINDHLEITEEG